jgi:hypothetical protein
VLEALLEETLVSAPRTRVCVDPESLSFTVLLNALIRVSIGVDRLAMAVGLVVTEDALVFDTSGRGIEAEAIFLAVEPLALIG